MIKKKKKEEEVKLQYILSQRLESRSLEDDDDDAASARSTSPFSNREDVFVIVPSVPACVCSNMNEFDQSSLSHTESPSPERLYLLRIMSQNKRDASCFF